MHLLVGLGNPGPQYAQTRHNVGFEVIDALAAKYRFPALRLQRQAAAARGFVGDCEAILCKPQTYMNESGMAVGAWARYYKVPTANLLVVHDELDFPVGEVRLKAGGGHGGHNGLRSIIGHLDADFARVRVGIGKPPSAARGADFVLSRFESAERQWIDGAIDAAIEAVEQFLTQGIVAAMNRCNRRP